MTARKHPLLWIGLTVSTTDHATAQDFRELFDLHESSALTSIDATIKRVKPAAICFDFDYPTKDGLKLLQQTKKTHTSVPLVMLTVQHSEALAIWAFRSRVWDYLVKPVTRGEIDRCLGCLREMLDNRDTATSPRQAAMPVSVIPQENRVSARRRPQPLMLAAALTYVEQNYSSKISSSEAAARCGLTPFQFSRAFKETYGLTFLEYALRFRIREACRLLQNPNAQVTDVAYLVGFNDASYFGKVFRRYTNVAPSSFHAANQPALDPERLLDVLEAD